jgi:hypothetical protein
MALVTKESLKISMIFNYWFAEMLGVGKSLYIYIYNRNSKAYCLI